MCIAKFIRMQFLENRDFNGFDKCCVPGTSKHSINTYWINEYNDATKITFLLTLAQKNIVSQILKVSSSAWFTFSHNIYPPMCHEWSSFANKKKEQWINPTISYENGNYYQVFKSFFVLCKICHLLVYPKGKEKTSNWVDRHGFPHSFFCTCDVWVWIRNHLVLCGSVSSSVYLEFHHLPFVIHRDAAGANGIIYVKALCKIKSHWLLSIPPSVCQSPAFCSMKGAREVTEEPNHSGSLTIPD